MWGGGITVVPLFPRWVCWYNIWAGLSFLFELFMPFFKNGMFARQGWLNFWVEFIVWFAYILLTTYYVFKAIPRLEQERAAELNLAAQSGKAAPARDPQGRLANA